MRKGSMILYMALAALVAGLSSCSLPTSTTASGGTSTENGTGTFSYAIAPFNPIVSKAYEYVHLRDFAVSKKSPARAFMSAAKVRFEIKKYVYDPVTYYGNYQLIDSWTIYPNTSVQAGDTTILGTRSVAAGDYYLYAYVYDDASTADTDYKVYGQSYFTVVDGQKAGDNQKTVVCSPNWSSLTSLSQGYESSGLTLAKPWTFDTTGKLTTIGSEAWYSFYRNSTDPINVTVTPDAGSKAIPWVFVFEGGTGVARVAGTGTGGMAQVNGQPAFATALTAGGTATVSGLSSTSNWGSYYVCVIDVGSASDTNRSYKVKFNAIVATPANILSVTAKGQDIPNSQPTTWIDGSLTSNSTPVWYSIDTVPGKTYYFWLNTYNYYDYMGYYNPRYYGDGTKTAEVIAAAYQGDYSTSFFTWATSNYATSQSFSATENKTYFKFASYYSTSGKNYDGLGTFGFNVTTDKSAMLTSDLVYPA